MQYTYQEENLSSPHLIYGNMFVDLLSKLWVSEKLGRDVDLINTPNNHKMPLIQINYTLLYNLEDKNLDYKMMETS